MIIKGGRLNLSPRGEGQHHPVDLFMTSLAAERGHRAIGVVLSGTATDGTVGLASIKEVGGITFAQDESAQHDGMPRSAIAAGVVDFVLPPLRIAREIVRLAHEPYVLEPIEASLGTTDGVDQILDLVREENGVDFSQYKSSTLHRRIKRRMALLKMGGLEDYAGYLRKNPVEIEALYQDILISVTNFFRDPEAFEALKGKVIPRLFNDRSRQDPIRVWVLGCSTGEEAYSLAIALTEYAAEVLARVPITIYATDLNMLNIERCRIAVYPKSIAHDMSAERLRRFFVEADGGYRITKAIRDLCVFAHHNVLAEPPFSRMDLISCRNVMIYMEPALQRKLVPIVHYALKPTGFLFLAPSETIGSDRELFEAEDAKNKIYSKKPAALRLEQTFPLLRAPRYPERLAEPRREPPRQPQLDLQREADRVLLTRYVPAGVLVNAEQEVLQFRGETGLYLTPAPGKASLNVLKMAREGLLVPLRSLLQRGKTENAPVSEHGVRVKSNGGHREISLTVVPIGRAASAERRYWILFESSEDTRVSTSSARSRQRKHRGRAGASPTEEARGQEEMRLTQELAATRDYLQAVIEQQEAGNEELQSANEEVQSTNEELQSINEELETSREEIQSSNEELTTVNEELQNRNQELNRANNDLNNIFSSVQMAIVMVWPDLRIRRFTPIAEKLLNLIAADVGRPIGDIQMNLSVRNLRELLSEVIESVAVKELEVQDKQGRWYLLRIRPYRTVDNMIDGAVVALVDIDLLKQSQDILQRHARMLEQTHDAVLVREMDGTIVHWNPGAELLYGYSSSEAQSRRTQDLLGGTEQQREAVGRALATGGRWSGELVQYARDGRQITVDNRELLFTEGERTLVLETNHDISERRRLEGNLRSRVEELASADRHKNEFLAMLAHELRNPLAPLRNAVHIMKMVGEGSETARNARDLIDRQVTTLARLVDDLLDAAHIGRGQVQLRTAAVDLQKIVQLAVETTRPMLQARKHRLTVRGLSAPLLLDADPMRLEQVFANLLSNAAKYTSDGGEISVLIERTETHASPGTSQAVVRVRDNGIGIEPEMLNRVFDLFFQVDQSLARTQGGLGIGLSLARTLVELHGGRVEAISAGLGRGSEFAVYIPLPSRTTESGAEGEDERPDEGGTSSVSASGPQRVLVVDDNEDIAESTSRLLALRGHEVKVALDGEQALRLAASFHPTTVLLDIGMPGLDGYQLCRKFRAGLVSATLVAVTGYGEAQNRARAKEVGFDHYLLKPVALETLESLLKQPARSPAD